MALIKQYFILQEKDTVQCLCSTVLPVLIQCVVNKLKTFQKFLFLYKKNSIHLTAFNFTPLQVPTHESCSDFFFRHSNHPLFKFPMNACKGLGTVSINIGPVHIQKLKFPHLQGVFVWNFLFITPSV